MDQRPASAWSRLVFSIAMASSTSATVTVSGGNVSLAADLAGTGRASWG